LCLQTEAQLYSSQVWWFSEIWAHLKQAEITKHIIKT
jgi:hypothetical protein